MTNRIFFETQPWAYDTTIAMVVAFIWLVAEYSSSASQRRLSWIHFFNVIWSILTLLLGALAIATFVFEQILRDQYKLSMPATIATILASSLSYVLVPDRLRLFDPLAPLVQKLLRCHKLRFSRIRGTRRSYKFIIEWRWWMRGDPENTWAEVRSWRFPNDQVLVEWGIDHRIGHALPEDIVKNIRRGDDFAWAAIGAMIYSWLPTLAYQHLSITSIFQKNGPLYHAYRGSRGRKIGCRCEQVPYELWIQEPTVEHFKLIAMEYRSAAHRMVSMLDQIAIEAQTPEDLANLFVTKWLEVL